MIYTALLTAVKYINGKYAEHKITITDQFEGNSDPADIFYLARIQ